MWDLSLADLTRDGDGRDILAVIVVVVAGAGAVRVGRRKSPCTGCCTCRRKASRVVVRGPWDPAWMNREERCRGGSRIGYGALPRRVMALTQTHTV